MLQLGQNPEPGIGKVLIGRQQGEKTSFFHLLLEVTSRVQILLKANQDLVAREGVLPTWSFLFPASSPSPAGIIVQNMSCACCPWPYDLPEFWEK
jgi:hypothetical protein